uniref:Uncharacterized protein n=1 Tax=Arundo donax TaxID=35708 RepID=A0A0A9AYP6_ARUDO
MVEMLALLKDWDQGKARAQHNIENKELEDSFDNLYLDGEADQSSVASM